MTAKKSGVLAIVTVLLAGGIPLGYVTMKSGTFQRTSQQSTSNQDQSTRKSQKQDSTSSSNVLSVKSGTASTDPSLGNLPVGESSTPSAYSSQSAATTILDNPSPTTENFAQYETYRDKTEVYFADIATGNGATLTKGKKVSILYRGWLTNGTLFDQSRTDQNGQITPFIFTVGENQVIPGLEQGIANMRVGGTRRIIIPPSLGYGESGSGDSIPPNSLLVFDVQILEVEP